MAIESGLQTVMSKLLQWKLGKKQANYFKTTRKVTFYPFKLNLKSLSIKHVESE